jgi:hypothetical protein
MIRRAIQAALRDVSAFWQKQHTRSNPGTSLLGTLVVALCKFSMQEYFRPLAAVASKLVMIH